MKRTIFFLLLLCGLMIIWGNPLEAQHKHVRKAYVAGQFYPGTKETLTAQIHSYLEQADKQDAPGPLHALVAPHAGYIYSGPIAAYAYKQIERPFKRIFLFASNHSQYANVNGLSVPEYTHYATPLGEVNVSPLARKLLEEEDISCVPMAHTTHIIEVHLPFLQTVLTNEFEIIPVITGRLNLDDIRRFGELFHRYVDDETLFLLSTDLSHYHPYDEAVNLDTSCVNALEALDFQGVIDSELCGQGAALILLEIAKKQGWKGKILDYRNSGDTAGEKSRVVGYGAIAYYAAYQSTSASQQPAEGSTSEPLNEKEHRLLLELARNTVELYVTEHTAYHPDEQLFESYPTLQEPRGTFVTLKKNGELRGCIGSLIGQQPLYLGVRDNAMKAAAHDPRFKPVTPEELDALDLSVSVLDVPALFTVETPDDYLSKLTHEDGVILTNGRRQATYLPQVWEQLPQPREFLGRLCMKARMSPACWQDPNTQIYTYRAQEFGEEYGQRSRFPKP